MLCSLMKKFFFVLLLTVSAFTAFSQVKITASEATKHVGDSVEISDQVYGGKLLNNGMTLLNLGGDFPDHLLTAVIKAEDRSKFKGKPEEDLVGKKVRINGKIEDYKGKPQVILTDPAQLIVIAEIKTPVPQKDIDN